MLDPRYQEREKYVIPVCGRNYLFDLNSSCFFRLSEDAVKALKGRNYSENTAISSELNRLRRIGLVDGPVRYDKSPAIRPLNSLSIFLTSDCNLNCKYCYDKHGKDMFASKGYLKEDVAKAAVDFLVTESGDEKNLKIFFSGGEPLMNVPMFEFILSYSSELARQKEKKISFSITTNGTIYTDRIVFFLKKYHVTMLISFDGPPEIQDSMRPFSNGKGSFSTVTRNIARYRATGIPIQIRSTVTKDNANIQKIFDYMTANDFGDFIISPASGDLQPDLKEIETSIVSLLRRCIEGKLAPEVLSRYANLKHLSAKVRQGKRWNMGCGAAAKQVAVSPDGRLYPCHRFVGLEAYEMGSIRTGVDEKKRNDFMNQCFILFREECSKCWVRYFCGGSCAYMNLLENDCINIPSKLNCNIFISTLKHLLPLIEDSKL